MEDNDAKLCPNCKREIPNVNFTIHEVHCARNIRVCPVCKEPVLQAELQEHHDKLHKLLPCGKCGESVCGTDLEDHVRDSCAHTIKSCRFCELELPRRELPVHEGYCGVRTEQCPDCREWVMIKYRQLHVDSNHGFLRLDDDPVPVPRKETPKVTNVAKPLVVKITNLPSTSNGVTRTTASKLDSTSLANGSSRYNDLQPVTVTSDNPRPFNYGRGSSNAGSACLTRALAPKLDNTSPANGSSRYNDIQTVTETDNNHRPFSYGRGSSNAGSSSGSNRHDGLPSSSSSVSRPSSGVQMNGMRPPLKRTNDQPQINTNMASPNKVEKNLSISRGAVKKRPAPKPPTREPPPEARRDLPFFSAVQRQQREYKQRQEQTAHNLSMGLPPVLSPAAKLEKLRKMDALQNPPEPPLDYKNRLQGRVWTASDQEHAGYVLGTPDSENNVRDPYIAGVSNDDNERRREEFKNVKPMTPGEFMERFNKLQLRKDGEGENRSGDRFSEIKSSLRELRRGLNEVTAPYNLNANPAPANSDPPRRRSARASPVAAADGEAGDVRLPCEFCAELLPPDDLVQHQTGCRPDLAQLRPPVPEARAVVIPRSTNDNREPVIPCEFCTESLPVYLIIEHQERCGRDANLLYAD